MGIKICPNCGGKVSTSRNICVHCNYVFPSSKKCPDCGEEVDENVKECPVCGYIFDDVPAQEPAPAKKIEENNDLEELEEIDDSGSSIEPVSDMQLEEVAPEEKPANEEIEEISEVEENNDIEELEETDSVPESAGAGEMVSVDNGAAPSLACPYCGDHELMEIGIDFYMCMTCKGRFVNTGVSIASPRTTVVAPAPAAAPAGASNDDVEEIEEVSEANESGEAAPIEEESKPGKEKAPKEKAPKEKQTEPKPEKKKKEEKPPRPKKEKKPRVKKPKVEVELTEEEVKRRRKPVAGFVFLIFAMVLFFMGFISDPYPDWYTTFPGAGFGLTVSCGVLALSFLFVFIYLFVQAKPIRIIAMVIAIIAIALAITFYVLGCIIYECPLMQRIIFGAYALMSIIAVIFIGLKK